jgi:hypothetical protein
MLPPPDAAGGTERGIGMGIGIEMGAGERIAVGYGSSGTEEEEEEEEEEGELSASRRDIGAGIDAEVGTSTGEMLGEGVDAPVMSSNFG